MVSVIIIIARARVAVGVCNRLAQKIGWCMKCLGCFQLDKWCYMHMSVQLSTQNVLHGDQVQCTSTN